MMLTPRQLAAYLQFSAELDRIEQAIALRITATAAQGDEKTIKQTLKELNPHAS
jgi:hypothetical protein